uniref:Uncharacterized protein n=1 Tax=Nelumbo nucifera TaxID=4432 RepID=A0A822ZKZ5_NELNU|nr:TPA_asm: hypothetical protein HUJ06_003787 [Nelumbo nucifera]
MRRRWCSYRRKRWLCKERRRRVMVLPMSRKTIRSPIERKLKKLESIVPGCKELDVDALFRETLNYILVLEFQVSVLTSLHNLYGL